MSEFKNFHVIKATLEIGTALTWATTDVNLTADSITIKAHGLHTGQSCGLTTTGTVPTGLTKLTTAYYVRVVDANTINFHTTASAAIDGTTEPIDLTGVGTGVGSLYPNGLGIVGLGQFVPDNAIITRAFYDVVTTFTSPTADTGSIALQALAANDLVTATTIVTGTTWDASGMIVTVPIETTSTMIKMTSTEELKAVLAADTVTAGKLNLYVEYLL